MDRFRIPTVYELGDREVTQSEIGKGYEYARDLVVAITDAELNNLPPSAVRVRLILQC
ncbi:hypothetical protein ACFYZ8_41305 [Streptomyces sp. NPDC001668]|uniref:hypothetical protein n=1 Tax=unclassified Streptomyces TaxID=2593676 RepID=UPI00367F74C0